MMMMMMMMLMKHRIEVGLWYDTGIYEDTRGRLYIIQVRETME